MLEVIRFVGTLSAGLQTQLRSTLPGSQQGSPKRKGQGQAKAGDGAEESEGKSRERKITGEEAWSRWEKKHQLSYVSR